MVGLLTAFRKSNPPGPGDWSWVSDFFSEPETQRLLEGGEPNRLDPEDQGRALCIEALRRYRKAYRDGNNELAWKHLEHAKEVYESVPEYRKEMKLVLWEFFKGWLGLEGPRKFRLSQHPIFKEFAALGGMDADHILAEIRSMEQSRRGSSARPPKCMTLQQRGLRCVLEESPNITAKELIDMVAAIRVYDYDDDDIRLYLNGNNELVIEEIKTGEKITPIPTRPLNHLRVYLKRARDRNS